MPRIQNLSEEIQSRRIRLENERERMPTLVNQEVFYSSEISMRDFEFFRNPSQDAPLFNFNESED